MDDLMVKLSSLTQIHIADDGVNDTTLHKYLIVHVCVLHCLQIMASLIGSQQTKKGIEDHNFNFNLINFSK